MTTAYTSLLGLALPVTGELSGTWGDTVNTAITSLLDTAIAGTTSITTDADITLSTTTGASNQARQAIILWNPASGTTTRNITAPAQSKMYVVINASGGTQSIVIRGAGPTTGVTIAKGESATVAWNGSDFVKVSSSGGAITFTDLTVTGNTILGDAAADTLTVNATSTFNAPVSFAGLVRLPSTGRSAAAALTVTAPAFLYGVASTYTDTTSSGTIAAMAPFYALSAPTLSTSNVTTYSFASTLYVAGAPAAGGSATITNPYALYVNSGASYLAGATSLGSTLGVTGVTTLAGALLANSNVTLGDAAADNITVTGTITSNLLFTDNTYDIGATAATRPRTGYFGTSVNIQSGQNAYGLVVGPTTGTWSVDGYTGIAFLIRNTGGGGVGGDGGGAYIQGYQPGSGNTGGLKFITRSDVSTTTTRYTIDETGISTWAAGSTPLSMTLNGTGLGVGVTSPVSRIDVRSPSSIIANYQQIQAFSTDTSAAIDLGGGIGLGGFHNSTQIATFGTIVGRKENGTSSNYAGYLAFGTNAQATGVVERMRIDSGGKLLLGLTSGSGLSNYDFAMINTGSIRFRNAANSAYINAFYFDAANGLQIGTGGSLYYITFGISGIGEVARFNNSTGYLGLFNSTPAAMLDVGPTASPSIPAAILRGGAGIGNTGGLGLYTNDVSASARNWGIVANSSAYGDFAIRQGTSVGSNPLSAGADKFYISNAGLVGIGTSSPATGRALTVSSTGADASIRINAPTGYYSYLELTENNSLTAGNYWQIGKIPTTNALQFWNGSERARITSGGGFYIGKTSGSTYLDVSTAFDYQATTFTSGAGNYGYLPLAQTPSSTVMLVNLTNSNNGNLNIAFLMLVNTRSTAFGGGNGVSIIAVTQGSTGTGGEINSYAFAITGSGTSLSLRATCTIVSGSATIDFTARIIQI